MPGKQLAIDSDMSAGAIDHEEAKKRRETEQQETTFFGSLDGASKFVKGDAIAGLLITLLNLVMGLLMGTIVHSMPIGQAFETYAILTVGDGLVTQIPAVIISIAAALLLARGGATGTSDNTLFKQLGRFPGALATVACLMGLFAVVPGLPFLPFLVGALALGAASYLLAKKHAEEEQNAVVPVDDSPKTPEKTLGDILDLDDIHVEFATDLIEMVLDAGTGLDSRINNMRTHIAVTYGMILPEIRLTDDASLLPGTYVIKIQGVEQAQDILMPDQVLALMNGGPAPTFQGPEIKEPVYGAPARWIDKSAAEDANLEGMTVVTPTEVLATHLLEVIKRNFSRLLTLKGLRRLLDEARSLSDPARAEANSKLIDDLIPDKVTLEMLLSVLRLMLDERVSIRNLPVILEAVAEARGSHARPENICEYVRQRIGFQLVAELRRPDGTIPLVQLAPEWEDVFRSHQIEGEQGALDVALPPETFNKLGSAITEKMAKAGDMGINAALVTSVHRRRFLKTVMVAKGLLNPVLSFDEIGVDARPSLVGLVPA